MDGTSFEAPLAGGTIMRAAALLIALALSPLLAAIAVTILVLDGRPVIFRQRRVGFRKAPFTIYKFRTMDDKGPTRCGRLLRATGLDELPQLLNIARGEMALIGPRPLTEADIARLGWDGPACAARWDARPGISGLAQLSRVCSARLSLHRDLLYVRRRSLLLDAWIFKESLLVPFTGKKGRGGP